MSEIYITSAKRTAVGSLGKSLKNIKAEDLGSEVIASVVNSATAARACVDVEEIVARHPRLARHAGRNQHLAFSLRALR